MDLILKPCLRSANVRDRMTSLPDELISRIFHFLLTKDAATLSLLSRTMRRIFKYYMTSFDLDVTPISHCVQRPHLMERFPGFTMLLNSVLQGSQSTEHLSRFRLRVGGGKPQNGWWCPVDANGNYMVHKCDKRCYPDCEPADVNAWMCFPLTSGCLRKLDLCVHLRHPEDVQLPTTIFSCETLEELKLDVNLKLNRGSIMPSFRLPNLKVLHLISAVIRDTIFVDRLVSSCPSLESLALEYCWWENSDFITISSPSLRRLDLHMPSKCYLGSLTHSIGVFIDTPNLEYFSYVDTIAHNYYVTNMNAIVKAVISMIYILDGFDSHKNYDEASFQNTLSLVRTFSNAQQLSLLGASLEALNFGDLKDQLPVFHNLNFLQLGQCMHFTWSNLLMEFLKCSPSLETLGFPTGLSYTMDALTDEYLQEVELEFEWKTTQPVPSCCRSRLKRIVIERYKGLEQEISMVKFLLINASVLEELVVYLCRWSKVDQMSVESALRKLPRSSITCSIRVHAVIKSQS